MNDATSYEAGEDISFDYTADKEQVIWGRYFEFGDVIVVRLRKAITPNDLYRNMGRGGPWGWGAFSTRWIESIADRVSWLTDNSILYRNRHSMPSRSNTLPAADRFSGSYIRPH